MNTIALLLSCTLLMQTQDDANTERLKIAKTLVGQIAASEFAAATEHFDEVMKRVLPADKLQKVWEGVVKNYGQLQKSDKTRTKTFKQYVFVFVTCEYERGKLDTKVVFTADNKITGLFFVPTGQYKPPSYADQSKFTEVDATVGEGIWSLPGTISLPNGDGPFPGVVLVHGSGPNDRDETIGPNKPFRDLAHGLASRGIAVLRYEKRTKHHQLKMSLLSSSITVKEETVDDAVSAVETLRSHKQIDENRVFVLGHSLGGNVIPRIAAATKHAAGFVSLAGSTTPLEDLVLEQTKYILSLDGEITEQEQQAITNLQTKIKRVKSPELSEKTPSKELPLGVPAKYWLDLRGYDPAERAKEIKRPLLILQGERDYQVTMKDFQHWKKALRSRSNVTFLSFPKLNHLFIAGQGKSSPSEYLIAGNVDKQVVSYIAEWVTDQTNVQ